MLTSKWHMNRFGLIDFWYYTNEEFYFKDGHMLLRGSNGSGKSVTMQSLIPLLLDGNKSSERLDTFGTRSRKIENYLLEENDDRDDRIGYLYLEFKRSDSDVYITIGMGLHARKGKQVDSWYFVIEDNRRVNIDIQLMEHGVAITRQQLKNLLPEQVIDTQTGYMEKVNQVLFGFESVDVYKEVITLLLKLRSPKLSNSLKPTMINEILSDSLQPLSEDDLRPMSEAITNMDNHKDRIDALKQSLSSVDAILKVYEKYNRSILLDKYQKYEHSMQKNADEWRAQEKNKKAKVEKEKELLTIQKNTKEIANEQELLLEEQQSLGTKDVAVLVDEITNIEEELKNKAVQIKNKEQTEEGKSNQFQDIKKNLQQINNDLEDKLATMKREFQELDQMQELLSFSEHEVMKAEVWKDVTKEYDYAYTMKQIEEEIKELKAGLQLFENYNREKIRLDNEVEQQSQWLDQMEKLKLELKQQEEQYRGIVEEYKEGFQSWNGDNEVLHMTDDDMHKIHQVLIDYEEETNYSWIKDKIHQVYQMYYHTMYSRELELKKEIDVLDDSINAIQNEVWEWENKKDIQPLQREEVSNNRKRLNDAGIPCKTLFSLLEFDEHVESYLKDAVEELLSMNGLLDTLVVQDLHRKEVIRKTAGCCDAYLFINQKVKDVPILYLHGNTMEELYQQLNAYFLSIGLDNKYFKFDENTYQYGFVEGMISGNQPAIYIGKQARETFRLQKLQQLQEELHKLRTKQENVRETYYKQQELIKKLEDEKNTYPKEEDIRVANMAMKDVQHDLETVIRDLHIAEEKINEQSKVLKELNAQLQQIAKHLDVPCDEEMFKEHLSVFEDYHSKIQNINLHHQGYINKLEIATLCQKNYENAIEDLDVLRSEIDQLQQEHEKLQSQMQSKRQQLDLLGYNEIKQRMEEISHRLKEIPAILTEHNQLIGNLDTEIKSLMEDIQNKEITIKDLTEQKELYYDILKQEIQLYYILDKETPEDEWLAELSLLSSNQEKRIGENLANELQMSVYNNRDTLQENSLTIKNIIPCHTLEDVIERIDIEARYRGNRISLIALRLNLVNDTELEESLLLESDKTLFEEILVNVISKKIRHHIQSSTYWVEQMNRYMSDMNTSSTLQLSLKWEKKKSESENELHTRELIELLQMDPLLMKQKDKDRLSNHFREKIKQARMQQEAEGNMMSFHQLMRDAMDYRKWFEFKIMSQKAGEKKKELTNNLFFSYSGGEKAMSMYIPLFSAVAAKFESAREDAPLLIALDEAFAGVDDTNIYNMFDLIRKFQFDYIINSQVLWGDYGSVPSLAIYELFRPENVHFVTCIAYEWDGKQKRMITR